MVSVGTETIEKNHALKRSTLLLLFVSALYHKEGLEFLNEQLPLVPGVWEKPRYRH